MHDPLHLKRIHHIELFVGNAMQAAFYYRKTFGLNQLAYLGPETGIRDRVSYVVGAHSIRLVLTSPLSHQSALNDFLRMHGDGVKDISFEVEDVDAVFAEVVRRGAEPVQHPSDLGDAGGTIRVASIKTFGDTIHSFISKQDYRGAFLPGYEARVLPGNDAGLIIVDHIVGNVEDAQMDRWVDWYSRTLGFHQFVSYDDKDISTEFTALRSKVMANEDRSIKFPINEPAPGRKKSQIQEYLDFNVTAGVQHIALRTTDILSTVRRMRANGVEFLAVPSTYYETLWDRVGEIAEERAAVERLGILVDRDDTGYLLQLFTKPVQDRPTLFFEVIQRRGCQSFGKGNFLALFEAIERAQALRGNL